MRAATFGIEEEFMMLSPVDLRPAPAAERVRVALAARQQLDGVVGPEFLASQLEYSTPILGDSASAFDLLPRFRAHLARVAGECGVVAMGAGLPFDADDKPAIANDGRYRAIGAGIRSLINDHQMNAMHVHIGVPSREAGVGALNSLRPWIPTLLALSANSPFWRGDDTGFASWRSILGRRWATSGCPPYFRDATDYDTRLARVVGVGAAADAGAIAWSARLSEKFPTIEIRVFDAQLDAESAILLAVLSRALVETTTSLPDVAEQNGELLDAALWMAARDGLSGTLLNPVTSDIVAAPDVLAALLRLIRPALESTGDYQFVADGVRRMLVHGTGAQTQRNAFRAGGRRGLASTFLRALNAAV